MLNDNTFLAWFVGIGAAIHEMIYYKYIGLSNHYTRSFIKVIKKIMPTELIYQSKNKKVKI